MRQRRPHRTGHAAFRPLEKHWFFKAFDQAGRDFLNPGGFDQPRKQQDEFITPDPGNGVFLPGFLDQHTRDMLKDVVTGAMAMGIVDLLEVIQIEVHQRKLRARAQ